MTITDDVREVFRVEDFYKVLRIAIDSNQQEIKKAYLQRSLELHPDKTTDEIKKEQFKLKFQILSEIYKILSDAKTREIYDRQFVNEIRLHEADSTAFEQVSIRSCDQDEDGNYYYTCRCSGLLILNKSHIDKKINAFIVDCESCSNSIRIVL